MLSAEQISVLFRFLPKVCIRDACHFASFSIHSYAVIDALSGGTQFELRQCRHLT
jgi:hypothetical protein